MHNIFIALISRTTSFLLNEVAPLNTPAEKGIKELSKHDFYAVAGGPQVDNDPEG